MGHMGQSTRGVKNSGITGENAEKTGNKRLKSGNKAAISDPFKLDFEFELPKLELDFAFDLDWEFQLCPVCEQQSNSKRAAKKRK
jgi:hypothetical protein